MSDIAIRVEQLSKRYKIGVHRHDRLKSLLSHSLNRVFSCARSAVSVLPSTDGSNPESVICNPQSDHIWALKDVSFEVKQGETLGIIGANGAGKSTLLKILSRITEPTSGRAEIFGKVGSLLDVGTGFDRELTGRENIYLNGAVLGMKKAEIDRKFDEIVDFSGVEKFIDTPVKHYSSGMYVRLAFAVAAHLEPEILIVDEVLAVGDAAFRKKCLGKMEHVSLEGRTVLFVSHNMAAVKTLCQRGIFLSNGRCLVDGTSSEVISTYLNSLENNASEDLTSRTDRHGRGQVRLTRIDVLGDGDHGSFILATGQRARFLFHVSALVPDMACIFTIYDHHGQPVVNFNSNMEGPGDSRDPTIASEFVCEIDELPLLPGRYRINAAITLDGELEDHIECGASFEVEKGHLDGRCVPNSGNYGSVYLKHRWKLPI